MKLVCLLEIIFLLVGCAARETTKQTPLELLIGKTVSDAVEHLNLRVSDDFVIDEPPGVPRGIYGSTPSGDDIELYVHRGDLLFSAHRDWKFEEFLEKQIIGIVKKENGKMNIYGDVPVGLYP